MRAISILMIVLFCITAAFLAVPPIMRNINLNVTCIGFLERAANANTTTLAEQQLEKALAEIERRGWTNGSSAVMFNHPQCDIGYWHENLTASLEELKSLPDTATGLEKSNMLMKLRETLYEQGEKSAHIILPPNINYYPNQVAWVVWWWIGSLLLVVFAICALAALDA